PTTANQQTYTWIKGSSHKLEAISPKTVFGDRYYWKKWGDDGSQTHYYTVPESGGGNVTAYFIKQFYLTVNSRYDEPLGEDWYDEGDTASFSVTSPYDYPNGTRAICDGYTADGGSLVASNSDTIPMDNDHIIDFQWTTSSLNRTITIDSNVYVDGKEVKVDGVEYDTPKTFSWVNTTEHTLEALSPLAFSTGGRHVWDHWVDEPTASNPRTYITPDPDGALTIMAFYRIQYFLTVNSAYDSPQGQGWYDISSDVSFNVTSPVEVNGTRYTCTGYEGDASGSTTSGIITMDSPKTITFLWEVSDYYLAVNSEYGTTHGEGWYKPGDTPEFYVTPEFIEEDGVRHVFQGWTGDYIDGANPAGANQILMDGAKTVTAVWRDRFFIEIISPYGSPKGSSWPFKGENFEVSVTSPDSGYVVTGFKLDGSSLQPGAKYMFVNVQEPHTIEFFWEVLTETTIFTINCDTNPPNKGTLVVGVTVYNHGESLTTLPGIYTIQANPDDDYSFTRWQTSGGVSVANSGSSTTTVTLAGDGTLTMIQQILGVAPPPGVWGGPETQFQCIIATAAYGGTMAPEVVYMRNVRDNMIGSTPIGNILVSGFNTFYYSWSPPVAQWIADSEGLRTTFRVLLLPISAAVHSAELVYTTVSPFSLTAASVTAFLLAAAISIGSYIIAPIFAGLTIYRKKYAPHT
ncbi:MAG: CFI-box-CTERM domain-containing protein, partial [Candidatus Bathyarchaeia archaeon]